MSDQNPWGTQPPSNPYGTPTPPPQAPPTPPYPQPGMGGGSGWNGGIPAYGGPPPGGQPPKRRTGLIVGIVAVVVLLVAALVVTLVVTGGDDEPDEASSSEPTSTATSEATEDPSPTESSEPTETTEPTDDPTSDGPPPAPGDVITGDGYTYALPATGWKEATADAKDLAATIDTAIILGASIDLSQSSIIVEALSGGSASSLEDLEGLWKRNLASSDGATPVDIEDTTIDGERAIGVRIEDRVNTGGIPIVQVAYLTLHDDKQYSIGLSFPKSGDEVSEDDFQTMLDSWSWSS